MVPQKNQKYIIMKIWDLQYLIETVSDQVRTFVLKAVYSNSISKSLHLMFGILLFKLSCKQIFMQVMEF